MPMLPPRLLYRSTCDIVRFGGGSGIVVALAGRYHYDGNAPIWSGTSPIGRFAALSTSPPAPYLPDGNVNNTYDNAILVSRFDRISSHSDRRWPSIGHADYGPSASVNSPNVCHSNGRFGQHSSQPRKRGVRHGQRR